MAAKQTCLVCASQASVFCENDGAFLCRECDHKVHTSNAVVARHNRVRVCELCHGKVSTVFCKNDKAFLCEDCDAEIHQSNPLAARHEVVPVKSMPLDKETEGCCGAAPPCESGVHSGSPEAEQESLLEVSALPNSITGTEGVVPVLGGESAAVVPDVVLPSKEALLKSSWGKEFDVLDLDNAWLDRLEMGFDFSDILADNNSTDGLVPTFGGAVEMTDDSIVPVVPSMPTEACSAPQVKQPSVPAATPVAHAQFMPVPPQLQQAVAYPAAPAAYGAVQPSARSTVPVPPAAAVEFPILTREQRVARYREKRKNRKFEKTIRYASRKAYAEVRPRIKGRFAKREELVAWQQGGEEGVVPEFDM